MHHVLIERPNLLVPENTYIVPVHEKVSFFSLQASTSSDGLAGDKFIPALQRNGQVCHNCLVRRVQSNQPCDLAVLFNVATHVLKESASTLLIPEATLGPSLRCG